MGRLEEGLEVALDCAVLAGDLAQDEQDTFCPILQKHSTVFLFFIPGSANGNKL